MTPEYKARREAKHTAQFANRQVEVSAEILTGTIDLIPKIPALAFIGGKMFKQSGMQRKGRSGHQREHQQALVDNAIFGLKM